MKPTKTLGLVPLCKSKVRHENPVTSKWKKHQFETELNNRYWFNTADPEDHLTFRFLMFSGDREKVHWEQMV